MEPCLPLHSLSSYPAKGNNPRRTLESPKSSKAQAVGGKAELGDLCSASPWPAGIGRARAASALPAPHPAAFFPGVSLQRDPRLFSHRHGAPCGGRGPPRPGGAPHGDRTPNTQPGPRFQLGPRPGEATPGGPLGAGLTAPVTTLKCGVAAWGRAPLRSSGGALPAPGAPRGPGGPRGLRKPGGGGAPHPHPRPGALVPPRRRSLGPGSLSTRESRGRRARSRETLPSARGHQPSGCPYLQGGRLLGGRRAWAMQPSSSVGPGHRGGGARGGDGGASGPRAADSALGRQQARARRAPLGPSRDRGGATRAEDWGRARRVPGSGPFPSGLRALAGAGGGDGTRIRGARGAGD